MKAHICYLSYVLRHKWFVFVAGLRVGAPLWALIIHDWSKFTPAEWGAYVHAFYAPDGSNQYKPSLAFDVAWNHHQKINPHHWQYWLLTMDAGDTRPLPMPERYIREMVADWMGAGRALGKPDVIGWYQAGKDQRTLHPETRLQVEEILNTLRVEGVLV